MPRQEVPPYECARQPDRHRRLRPRRHHRARGRPAVLGRHRSVQAEVSLRDVFRRRGDRPPKGRAGVDAGCPDRRSEGRADPLGQIAGRSLRRYGTRQLTRCPASRHSSRDPDCDQGRSFRGQLRAQSFVTGVLYVAIDEFPGTPIVLRGLDPSVLAMPPVPTDLERWEAKLERLSDAVAAMPLQEIAQSVLGTVEEARRLLKSPEVTSSLKNLDAALADARGLIRKADTLAANVHAQV